MRLNWLMLHWERLARRDPFFAVLTDVDKRFGGHDVDAFYRSGVEEIAAILQRADERGLAVHRRRALDFGCGVGRLTLALADQFERTDGVDISSSMLAVARRRCPHPERCVFHRNRSEDLALFADRSFSFVYSTLVLQHMAPRLSTIYIRELVRVLADDGLLVFQLPSEVIRRESAGDAVRSSIAGALPPDAFAAQLSVGVAALDGHAGERMLLDVTVSNQSNHLWPSLPDARGRRQIHVANRWLDPHGALLQRDDERAALPEDVPPGGRVTVLLGVRPPRVNGQYVLELDLVQEHVGWFAEHGSQPLRIPCAVTGGVDGPPLTPLDAPLPAISVPRFSERHPQIFALLRGTGLRDLYWSGRRALDRVRTGRDRAIRRVLHPWINRWERVSFAPRMDMHCIPTAAVCAIVGESGGRVAHIDEEMMAGGYRSCRYWVRRG